MAKLMRLDWQKYGVLSAELAQKIWEDGARFDKVIGIARGGIPLAMVIGDRLDVRIEIINVKSYDGIGSRTAPEILSTISSSIDGQRILLVDDLVDQGDTMKRVVGYLAQYKPQHIKSAALFRKPWSTFLPDYCLGETDEWVVFPWDEHETERALEK